MSTGNSLTDAEIRRFFALCDDESDGILRLDEFLKVIFVHVGACSWLRKRMCDGCTFCSAAGSVQSTVIGHVTDKDERLKA